MITNSSLIIAIDFILLIVSLLVLPNKPEKSFGMIFFWLVLSQQVTTQQILDSISNEGVISLILLMMISSSIEKTRIIKKASQYIFTKNFLYSWMKMYFITVISSSFLNNTAVVSMLLRPIKNNNYHPATRFLLPLSFAAIFGGTLTLVGTSTNLIINSLISKGHGPSLSFFDFTPIGIAVVILCAPALYFLSKNLPNNSEEELQNFNYIVDLKVQKVSALVGRTIKQNNLRNLDGLFLFEIIRSDRVISPVSPQEIIEESDRLIFSGDIKKITQLNHFHGLTSFADKNDLPLDNLVEVIIKNDSHLVGRTLKESGFRALFNAAVVGIRRDGEALSGKLGQQILRSGDYLTLAVGDDFQTRKNIKKNFFVISDIKTEEVIEGFKEYFVSIGFLVTLLLSAIGIVSLFKGLLLFFSLLLFSGCLNTNEILRRFPIKIWLIITSAILLSQAFTNSLLPQSISDMVNHYQLFITPFTGMIILYVLTWIVTELVTNNAAAILMFPIGYSLAQSLQVPIHAYMLCIAFAASASFILPYGYQTNLMAYSAGSYRLVDFIKIGIPISILYSITVITMINALYL